jgi:hypothetical protein
VDAPADSRTFILSSQLYGHLKKGDFSNVDGVKDLLKEYTRLAFGICEKQHWVVILMDLEAKIIFYYNSSEEARPDPARRTDTLEVSFSPLKHCFSALTMLELVR